MLTLAQDTMLGNIPSDWRAKPLKKLLALNTPGDWGEDRGPNMVRVVRSTNLTSGGHLDLTDVALRALDPKKAAILRPFKNDILLERSGGGPDQPVGRVGFVENDMPEHGFSNFLHLLRPDKGKVNPRFLAWVLLQINQTGRILRLEQQTTQMRNLNFRDYLTMPLPSPPPEEQESIAMLLDSADTAISCTSDSIRRAAELKHAVVQDFFIAALGQTAYADHPTKPLPAGWKLLRTDELIWGEPKNGVSPATFSQPPGVPTFSIAAVRDGRVDLSKTEHLKFAILTDKIADKFRIAKGDVLIVRGNANPDLVGKAGQITTFPEGCIYPDITMRVRFRDDVDHPITPEYAVLVWNHPIVHNQVLRRAKTSNGTLKINKQDVKQMILPVPPPDEQESITRLAGTCDEKSAALAERLSALEELKKALMNDLLTGTVRVDPKLFEEEALV